jgi:hypothetical protein
MMGWMMRCCWTWVLGLGLSLVSAAWAGAGVSFSREVLPILSDACFACHGPDEAARKGGLRLDVREGALAAGDSGAVAVLPGEAAASELVKRILASARDEVMPPPRAARHLSAVEKEILQRWVDEGAVWGSHWAYELPQALIPGSGAGSGGVNGVDDWVGLRLEQEGLSFAPMAEPATLIRRVTLDLTGLLPEPEAVAAFVAASAAGGLAAELAYRQLVERLLGSPRFGERWAWDWLDAARYADSNGFQGDPERTMWPWRDWVVAAINANMPYDQFTVEQLAGDLLPDATQSQLLASGFHRNNMHNGEGGRIAEETRVENVFDRVETTATVWLGSTFNCCRCHDHKYDPLRQVDYFALYDIFNQMSETGAGRGGKAPPVLHLETEEERAAVEVANANLASVVKEVEAFERKKFPRPEGAPLTESAAAGLPGNLSATLAAREPKTRGVDAILEAIGYFKSDGADADYVKVLERHLGAVRRRDAAVAAQTQVMIMDQLPQLRDTFVLDKGAYDKPMDQKVLGAMPVALVKEPAAGPQRATRLDLARWLVSRENPLTARVTVNRYWQALFGVGLVKTAEDFGLQGEMPSHPELLDWLAVDLMENGWDIKRLLRTLVLSRTYRQDSRVSPGLLERDPENRLLARGPRHRLPFWMLRDVALSAAGLLRPELGGPGVKPYQPPGIWEEATFGKKTYVQDHGAALYRRSLYLFWRRIVGPTLFVDSAARQVCEVKVKRTNTPLHALITLNDTGYVEAARCLAEQVMLESQGAEERIQLAAMRVLSRPLGSAELEVLLGRLAVLRQQFQREPSAVEALLAVGEAPRAAGLEGGEHAAFTVLVQLLLNLDEALSKE